MPREIGADAFEQLYRATVGELLGYARRRGASDPEDLVAEAFATAWRRREDLPAERLQRAWLFSTARRLLLADARARGRRREVLDELDRGVGTERDEPSDPTVRAVLEALADLPAGDRELIELVEWQDMTPAEVAVVLGLRPGTVRVRLHRARRALAADPRLRDLVDGRLTCRAP